MSKSCEQQGGGELDYRRNVHDYFFSQSARQDERAYYESRNLTFTNNLHIWFVDDPKPEIYEGIKNPYDYRQREFGPVLERFRAEYPDLWKEVQQAVAAQKGALAIEIDRFNTGSITPEALQEYFDEQKDRSRELKLRADEVKSRAFDIIGPMLVEAGIEPVAVCR